MCSLLLNGINVKNETSNSKVVMILIYQNVTCSGKKSDFLFFFEHYKIPQYKQQIHFKTKKIGRGDNTYIDNMNFVMEKSPIHPAFLMEIECPGLCDSVEYSL